MAGTSMPLPAANGIRKRCSNSRSIWRKTCDCSNRRTPATFSQSSHCTRRNPKSARQPSIGSPLFAVFARSSQAATTAANSFFDGGFPAAVCHSRSSEDAFADVVASPMAHAMRPTNTTSATPRISNTPELLHKLSPPELYSVRPGSTTLFRFNDSRSRSLDFAEPELVGEAIAFRQAAQLVPSGILDFDAVGAAILLAHVLDFARIVYAAAAFGRLCRFQILHELADLLLELGERPEGVDLEDGHEAAVIVAPGRLDPKAEPGQQPAEDLDHDREAITLVAFTAAYRKQRAAPAQLARIGGRPAVAVDDPARRHRRAARDGERDLAGRCRRGGHVEVERPFQIGRHRDRDRVGAEPRLAPAKRRHRLGRAPGIG